MPPRIVSPGVLQGSAGAGPRGRDFGILLDELRAFHTLVEQEAQALAERHGPRITCRPGCSICCRDGLTVFSIEAARIAEEYLELLGKGTSHPKGACAFLDGSGRCRIYPARPHVCRTHGLPLSWVEPAEDGGWKELRDICPLNEVGPVLEDLDTGLVWEIGPHEQRLAELQRSFDPSMKRVALRDLFGGEEPAPGGKGHPG